MALPHMVQKRGTLFKGYQLTVAASTGDYVVVIPNTNTNGSVYINSMEFIPDASGAGDTVTIERFDSTATDGSATSIRILGETLYIPGPYTPYKLPFPALEEVKQGESVQFTYSNVGGTAVNVNVYVEFLR